VVLCRLKLNLEKSDCLNTINKLDVLRTLGLSPCATIAFAFLIFPYGLNSAFAQGQLNDPSLTIQVMVDGLASPTSLIFLDSNNILL